MPELPEVETTRRSVAPSVVGRRIAKLIVYDPRLRWPVPRDLPKKVEGRTVDDVSRRSKYLLFRIGDGSLLVHFGMTGSLRVHTHAPERRPHDHVDIVFNDGSRLRYHDPRRFGAMLWAPDPALTHPLLPQVDAARSRAEIVDSKREIEAHVPYALTSFCYPAGLYGPREVEYVREAGYAAAVTTNPGVNAGGGELLELRRTLVYGADDQRTFTAKLDGLLDTETVLQRALQARRSRAA